MAADFIFDQDVLHVAEDAALGVLEGSTVLVTGSTGLIGSLMVKGLLKHNEVSGAAPIGVVALARSEQKAARVFAGYEDDENLRVVYGSTTELPDMPFDIDWISHGASMTASKDFAARPVEVMKTEVEGTFNILELAREKQVKGMVYLSSLEVYGSFDAGYGEVREDAQGTLDRMNPRNSYPVAKQMCETLCVSYASEYGVPVKIARLAQTFGAGVSYADNRVFADFAKKIIEHTDIVMHTPGTGGRCYCYTSDAVRALLCIMGAGVAGEAYNVSNRATYCEVHEMAKMLIERYPESGSELVFDMPEDLSAFGYAEPSKTKLNAEKLLGLGWQPDYDLGQMYDRLIESLKLQAGPGAA